MNNKKYAICRPLDGITLNTEVEYVLNAPYPYGDVILFDSEEEAWDFLKPHNLSDDELAVIRVVEWDEEKEENHERINC